MLKSKPKVKRIWRLTKQWIEWWFKVCRGKLIQKLGAKTWIQILKKLGCIPISVWNTEQMYSLYNFGTKKFANRKMT
jgi:hypothetical protein